MPAAVAAAECAPPRDAEIAVTLQEAPLQIDRTSSYAELTRRVGGLPSGPSVFGITEGSRATDISYRFGILPMDGQYCVTFDRIAVAIEVTMVVHLASELVPGTCADRVYAGHEQQHVDIDRELLPMLRDRVAAAATYAGRRSVVAATEEAGLKLLQEAARREIRQALDRYSEERDRRQNALDTPAEYARLQRQCPEAEIRALLGQ